MWCIQLLVYILLVLVVGLYDINFLKKTNVLSIVFIGGLLYILCKYNQKVLSWILLIPVLVVTLMTLYYER